MRVLVLGAYGLIGAEIVRSLRRVGHDVAGLVRSANRAARLLPGVECVEADIAALRAAGDWRGVIAGFDAVVNASGALQTGLRDNLARLQDDAIQALIAACEEAETGAFVQISAPGAEADASTEFMRSKAHADNALRASALPWIIFKPGLVISPTAYGGTALIRALAGFPVVQPIVTPEVRIQTVSASEVGEAVADALAGRAPMRRTYDLVGEKAYALADIVSQFRRWLGNAPPRAVIVLPRGLGYLAARGGDAAGWLGWRSPLRTTALKVLEKDVRGDPRPWKEVTGRPLRSLEETLALTPSTLQERVFARAQLLTPAIVLILSLFFITSGVIGLFRAAAAEAVLAGAMNESAARLMIISGSCIDIFLGALILVRAWLRFSAAAMIALSLVYLGLGTIFAPALWADPLGPFVKIFPVMGLALCTLLLVEER